MINNESRRQLQDSIIEQAKDDVDLLISRAQGFLDDFGEIYPEAVQEEVYKLQIIKQALYILENRAQED